MAASGQYVTIQVVTHGDGDAKHRPTDTKHRRTDDEPTRLKLAALWVTDQGIATSGQVYIFDRLPAGFEVWEKKSQKGAGNRNRNDKYIYGHPSQKIFDSVVKFYPHVVHLITNLASASSSCACCLCNETQAPRPKLQAIQGRPSLVTGPEDHAMDSSTPMEILDQLRVELHVDRPCLDMESMDWRADRPVLERMSKKVPQQYSFIPRSGEMVFWSSEDIKLDPISGNIKMLDPVTQAYNKEPEWIGGIVTQVPEENVTEYDLVRETPKQYGLNMSGFRVEPYPSLCSRNKNLSLQHKHIPLHRIRPMSFWKEVIQDNGTHDKGYDLTIGNCLSAMAIFSIFESYRFYGIWPSANLYYKGMFLGAECLWVGDAVRLIPEHPGSVVHEVLRISHIIIKYTDLQAGPDGVTLGPIGNGIRVVLRGWVYTLDSGRCGQEVTGDDLTPGMNGYGTWYHTDFPAELCEISFPRVLGRCYERQGMEAWLPHHAKEDLLSAGLEGTTEARDHAGQNDPRLQGTGQKWYWGDFRAEALDIAMFNNYEVGKYDSERDPEKWRNVLHVLDGTNNQPIMKPSIPAGRFTSINTPASNTVVSAYANHASGEKEQDEDSGNTNAQQAHSRQDSAEEELNTVVDGFIAGELREGHEEEEADATIHGGQESADPAHKRACLDPTI